MGRFRKKELLWGVHSVVVLLSYSNKKALTDFELLGKPVLSDMGSAFSSTPQQADRSPSGTCGSTAAHRSPVFRRSTYQSDKKSIKTPKKREDVSAVRDVSASKRAGPLAAVLANPKVQEAVVEKGIDGGRKVSGQTTTDH
ncbi:hypothetical protein OS493_037740 [Desmophyllum pertusum]|uniref:Uncharacterized protein n=1 Tax=Desmophyllum pertusum TaxID=174260 RepID=A0A9W9YHW7_9CNID|nr:hypothetical protein OS493_037740 [Desmophyllum pertusum]